MDNTKIAMLLYRYMESEYPIDNIFGMQKIKMQSARRWAIAVLADSVLSHPHDDPVLLAEMFVGRLACMINHISVNNSRCSNVYEEALGALIKVEEKILKR